MYLDMDDTLVKKRFGDFLDSELQRTKLSQSELGRRTNIHACDINRYVRGEAMPLLDRFIRINEALDRSPGRTLMRIIYGEK